MPPSWISRASSFVVSFVELQAFSAVDFGISLLEPYAKRCQIALVLFNQPVYGFLNKRIGVVIIAPRDFFTDSLLKVGPQSDIHSCMALPKVDRISCDCASGDWTSGHHLVSSIDPSIVPKTVRPVTASGWK